MTPDDVTSRGQRTESHRMRADQMTPPCTACRPIFQKTDAANDSICPEFVSFINNMDLPFFPSERKKWGATHVGLTPAMFSSQSKRTMASIR